jgi:hypothetical protein
VGSLVTIESGDTVAGLAALHGFADPHIVWGDPENAPLRTRRQLDLLAPGDQLYIPARELRTVKVATGRRHTLKVARPAIRLRVALHDLLGQPRAGAAAVLEVDGVPQDLTADDEGVVEMAIPPTAREAVLVVDDQEYGLEIGKLPPIDDDQGVAHRLRNLGYLVDDTDDAAAVRFAVELFQVDHGLTVDGADLDSIRQRLVEVHGC